MGTHLRVLSESYLMNTNVACLDGFQTSLRSCAFIKVALALEGLRGCLSVIEGHGMLPAFLNTELTPLNS